MGNKITINGTAIWQVQQDPNGFVVAWCDPLGLTLEADDSQELGTLIEESYHHLFSSLIEDNEFDAFLAKRGWSRSGDVPRERLLGFNLPTELVNAA